MIRNILPRPDGAVFLRCALSLRQCREYQAASCVPRNTLYGNLRYGPLLYGTQLYAAPRGAQKTQSVPRGSVGYLTGTICGRGDLNPHALRHQILNLTCLPFHHPRRGSDGTEFGSQKQRNERHTIMTEKTGRDNAGSRCSPRNVPRGEETG